MGPSSRFALVPSAVAQAGSSWEEPCCSEHFATLRGSAKAGGGPLLGHVHLPRVSGSGPWRSLFLLLFVIGYYFN